MMLNEPKKSTDSYSFQRVEDEDNDSTSPFDKLLEEVGSEGKFQKALIFGFMMPLALINSLCTTNPALLLSTPEHSCFVPGRPSENITLEHWKNLTIPREENLSGNLQLSSCFMFNDSDYLQAISNGDREFVSGNELDKATANLSIVGCQHGWDFDTSEWLETPVTKFGWVCDQKHIVPFIFSLGYAGSAIGTLFFSIMSDRYGRKPVFYFVLVLNVVSSIASIFAPSLVVFSAFRFLLSLAFMSFCQLPFIIVVELCSERLRNLTAMFCFISFVLGKCLISVIAYISAQWKILILACHLPSVIFFLYFRALPESPRWLLFRSRVAECEEILKRIARINGKSFTDRSRRLLLHAQKEETRKKPMKDMFTSFVLVKHIILTSILLSIGYIMYTGMILNIHNMPGNKFLNFLILSLVEIPGHATGTACSQFLGRRSSAVIFTSLASLCCIISAFVVEDPMALIIMCGLTEMFVGAILLVVYMQVGELFPTPLRATAYGITGVIGIATIVIVPPIIAMGGSQVHLPYYILFGICLLGVVLSTFLPETIGRPLPQTLNEATRIGTNQPYLSLIHKWNAHKYLDEDLALNETFRRTPDDFEHCVHRYD